MIRAAQVPEPHHPFAEVVAPGYIATGNAPVFDNLFVKRDNLPAFVKQALFQAEGYYRDETRRSLVPVFWPSVVAHLPSDLLVVVGASPNGVATRAATAIGWVAIVVLAIGAVVQLVT